MKLRKGTHALVAWAAPVAIAVGCGGGATTTSDAPVTSSIDDASAGDARTPPPADASNIDSTSSAIAIGDASPPDAAGPNQCGYTPCAPGKPCGDLIIDRNEMANSIVINTQTFEPTSCEIVEGCITTPGTRRLLRFDMATVNAGTADLVLGPPQSEACFQWSDCHGHYHFQGFAAYTLYRSDGVTVAAVGHKQAFCLEDVTPSTLFNPQAPNPAQPFDCTRQGIHIGWEDIYPNDVPCQWIDITDVPPGNYVLSAVVNASRAIPELNFANNEARVPVTIP